MRYLILLLPVVLAACNKGGSVSAENASIAEVEAKVKAAGATVQLSPGRWETSVKVDRMEVPGMPPAMAAHMQQQLSQVAHGASCLTPEQARKPAADFFAGKKSQDCRYDSFTMGDGKIDAAMTCGSGNPKIAATLKGTYAPETFRMAILMDGKGQASVPTIAMTVDARHVGACTGKEAS